MGDDPTHWEGVGKIPPQGGSKPDGESNLSREGQRVDISPAGGRDGGSGTAVGGEILLPPPEHSHTVYCN